MDTASNILVKKNLNNLLQTSPSLKKIFISLNEEHIKYGIFAGACVSIFTSNRKPTDIDILVADEDFNRLTKLFIGTVKSVNSGAARSKLFYLEENSDLEFVSKLDFIVNKKVFPIRLTPLAWNNIIRFTVEGTPIIILNPVDTLIEKAIAPRGEEVGKHDLEDIAALLKDAPIDEEYLEKRATEMKAKDQLAVVFENYNIYDNSVYRDTVFGRSSK